MTGPERRPGFDLARWRSACDRNQTLAVADYLARVRRAAQATAEVTGTKPAAQICRDLSALGAALGAVLDLHSPRPPAITGVDPAFPRIVSTGSRERLTRPPSAGFGGRCRACASMLRHAGWPCATRRAIARALDGWDVLP